MLCFCRMRTVLNIALAAGAVFSAALPGLACGFNWTPPGGHFECCDDQGYVLLTEKLADMEIPGERESVPVYAVFNSGRAVPTPYAGMWRIGILDITLVQVSDTQFQLRDPGGGETLLTRNKKDKTIVEGAGWKGILTADRAKLSASCGWGAEFYRGRVSKITTPHSKTLVYNYADGCVSSITCDGKPLVTVGGAKSDTMEMTVNGKKLRIAMAGQPVVRRAGGADAVAGTEKSLSSITGDGGPWRSYSYAVDEKMRHMVTVAETDGQTFTLAWDPQTRKITRFKDWEYTKTRDRKNRGDTIELARKNGNGDIESYYYSIRSGIRIRQQGAFKRSEHRFTSGPAAGKIRRIEETVNDKVTHFQQYAYDEKGRMIRAVENKDTLAFKHDDKNRTSAAWKNDVFLWKKHLDEKGRIVKVEYPDGKELRYTHHDNRPSEAELVWKGVSVSVQLDSDGWIKDGTEAVNGAAAKK